MDMAEGTGQNRQWFLLPGIQQPQLKIVPRRERKRRMILQGLDEFPCARGFDQIAAAVGAPHGMTGKP
jgi:hypothetical protein